MAALQGSSSSVFVLVFFATFCTEFWLWTGILCIHEFLAALSGVSLMVIYLLPSTIRPLNRLKTQRPKREIWPEMKASARIYWQNFYSRNLKYFVCFLLTLSIQDINAKCVSLPGFASNPWFILSGIEPLGPGCSAFHSLPSHIGEQSCSQCLCLYVSNRRHEKTTQGTIFFVGVDVKRVNQSIILWIFSSAANDWQKLRVILSKEDAH